MCNQHSAAFPNQVPSFNPLRKEDLKWSMVARKPRYSEHMESGVLYFVASGENIMEVMESGWVRLGYGLWMYPNPFQWEWRCELQQEWYRGNLKVLGE